jgi:hemoglobin
MNTLNTNSYFYREIFKQAWVTMEVATLYERLGEENLKLLVDRFYDLVFENEQISRLFKTDKSLIKKKQRLFLTQFFGGPPLYSNQYGHPQLRARHMPHPIGEEDAVVWLQCMSAAVHSLEIDAALKDELMKRFIPTAMFMVNRGEDSQD